MVIGLISLVLTSKKKKLGKFRVVVGKFFSIILSIVLLIGSIFVTQSSTFLRRIYGSDEFITYTLVALKSSGYKKAKDIKGKRVGYEKDVDTEYFSDIFSELKKEVSFRSTDYKDYKKLGNALYKGTKDAILINDAYRTIIEADHPDFEEETNIIWFKTIKVKSDNEASKVNVTKESFVVLVTGVDSRGSVNEQSRSDVNMVFTINPKTKKVMITNIPRDYYVTLYKENAKDKMTHSGLSGAANTEKTAENLLNINIDYYARVNFRCLVKLVNAVGGVDVYSDADLTGVGVNVKVGMNHMDGRTALQFCRTRYAYATGDTHRSENQQAVVMALMKKMMSPTVLVKYSSILDAISKNFTTNMPTSSIKKLVNMQLNDGASWKISKNILKGTGTKMTGGYYMPSSSLYYTIPDEENVQSTHDQIIALMEEKPE